MKIDQTWGATPLDPDDVAGLIPSHITTQAQLNEWEQINILEAEKWIRNHRFEIEGILKIDFIKKLHHKQFNKTWKWAGQFRNSNKNIGIDWPMISIQLKLLLDDVQYQIVNKIYGTDEIALRFHHRLVAIHPFANGNGRHARLITDILLIAQDRPRFTWGSTNLNEPNQIRVSYINSLRAADKHDYTQLTEFVRQ